MFKSEKHNLIADITFRIIALIVIYSTITFKPPLWFNTVDKDHNVLMHIQGTKTDSLAGLATGIATEEQEIHYIHMVFAKQVDEVFGSTENRIKFFVFDGKRWLFFM